MIIIGEAGVSVQGSGFGGGGGRRGGRHGGRRAEGFLEGCLDFQLDGGDNGGIWERGIGERLPGEAGGHLNRVRDLGERHFLDLQIAEGFEEALGGGAELPSALPFLLSTFPGAAGPIVGAVLVECEPGRHLLLEQLGIEGGDPAGPAMPAGPFFIESSFSPNWSATAASERVWPRSK